MVSEKKDCTIAPVRVTGDEKKFIKEMSDAFKTTEAAVVRGSLSYLKNREDPIKELSACI
jgi:hypothetical protein